MEVIRGYHQINKAYPHAVITIGNFDGVHLGHQEIIRQAIEKARTRGGQCLAYTFRPHPQVALRPGANVQLLTTYDEKLELLERAGLDAVVEEPFSREFSTVTPHEFFREVLLRKLSVEAIVVGYDFAFGKERQGHLDALGELCRTSGVELTVVSPQRIGGEVVSSSRIRQHLMAREVGAASRLLGREFFYRGIVMKGDGRGRTIGYPTANLKIENKLALPYGVYATRAVCRINGEVREFASVTNVGVRPTFVAPEGAAGLSTLPALVETHLLDASLDLYGNTLEVRFVKNLREERKFSSVNELVAQIGRDADQARSILR